MREKTPKDIAVFIDGTWNTRGSRASTNVRKLYGATLAGKVADRRQVKLYISGVGTKPVAEGEALEDEEYRAHLALHLERELPIGLGATRSAAGGAFGIGTAGRIKAAYRTICDEFDQRTDKVFLFGFSRGAFAARSLAGFMEKVGLLLREKLDAVEEAYALYESGDDPLQSPLAKFLYKLTGRRMPGPEDEAWLPVHFLGVWDTVASLGLPSRLEWWLSAPFTEYHQVDIPPNVVRARHGLALHELRASFEPLLWKRGGHTDLKQVWFPGAHADVGGGYRKGETGLSDVSLLWMADEAEAMGLALDRACSYLNPVSCVPQVHHEMRGLFLPTIPSARKWLRVPTWDSGETFYFHESAREYLFATPRPTYAYRHPLVNAALRQVDELAAPHMVASLLLGNRVVS